MFADYTPEEVTFPQHPLFKIFFFFDVGHFLKFLLNLLQYCFLFYVLFCFWPQGRWDLSSPVRDQTRVPGIGR